MPFWGRASRDADKPGDVNVKEPLRAARACEQELHIVAALDRALEDPLRVFALVVNADTVQDARAVVQQEYALDEDQATAILDLQWRRGPRAERERVREMRDDLLRTLKELNDSLTERASKQAVRVCAIPRSDEELGSDRVDGELHP